MSEHRFIPFSHLLPTLLLCVFVGQAHSQRPDPLPDSLIAYWHKAYFAEVSNDLDGIIDDYHQVIRYSRGLPARLQDWYLASAYFGIAKTNSVIGDRDATRQYLDSALSHHFWNFEMIGSVPSYQKLMGKQFVDSICTAWRTIVNGVAPTWPPELPIYIRPTHIIHGKKYPVVIALHGGNGSYELFSHRLSDLADKLGAIVVFLPGQLRISETANAWGNNMPECVGYLDRLFDEVAAQPDMDMHDVTLVGFSQGSQAAYAYCTEHPERVHAVIAFAGFAPQVLNQHNLDSKLQAAAKHRVRIAAVSGEHDYEQFISSTRELQARATLAGLNFTYKLEPAMPHGIPEHASEYIRDLWHQLRGVGQSHLSSTQRQ